MLSRQRKETTMGWISISRKARILAGLVRKKKLRLGGSDYWTRGFFLNPLALTEQPEGREPWLEGVLRAMLGSREGAFLDVGANIGQTLLTVLAIEKTREYVGFEPQIACSFVIQRFIKDNDLKTCTILPIGLFTDNQIVPMQLQEGDYDSTASLIENFRPSSFYTSQQYVCVRKGDEVVAELNLSSIAAIKIDAEGAELEVIEGLLSTIRRHKPFIVFEVLNSYLVVTGKKLDDEIIEFRAKRIEKIEAILKDQGYDIYNALPGNVLRLVDKIKPAVSADLSQTNYVAVPEIGSRSFLPNVVLSAGTPSHISRT
jgi:FkbM family methyltransferase